MEERAAAALLSDREADGSHVDNRAAGSSGYRYRNGSRRCDLRRRGYW